MIVRAFDEGWRLFLVVREGPKHTSLLDLGSLRHQKISTAQFRREMKPQALAISQEKVLRRLRKRRKMFRRCGAGYSPIVDQVLQECQPT